MAESSLIASLVPAELLDRLAAAFSARSELIHSHDGKPDAPVRAHWSALAEVEDELAAVYNELYSALYQHDQLIAVAMSHASRAFQWDAKDSRKLIEIARGTR